MYEIYMHTNTTNDKKYIGLTRRGMETRWRHHLVRARNESKRGKATYFQNALLKYGPDVWTHAVLEFVGSLEEAELAETKWIAYYKSNQRECGYNCTDGGNVSRGPLQPEVRKKISETVKLQMAAPERREAQSVAMKKHWETHDNPFLGKTHTDESKSIMSAKVKAYHLDHDNAFKGKTHSEETRRKMSEASKKRCADPNWRAPLQLKPLSEETRKKMSEARKGKHTGSISKEMILEVCRGCRYQNQIATKLGCTPANVSFLIRSFDIRKEVNERLI